MRRNRAAALALLGAVAALALWHGQGLQASPAAGRARVPARGAAARPRSSGTTSTTAAPVATCPLTGMPAPAGRVPARPALAIKVGNDPPARPQSGLSTADVVFEVQVEGGITRFIALYQCAGAPAVGPVRSSRWVDVQLLEQLGHPIFGFAGGILPDERAIAASPLFDANFLKYYGAYYRTSSRVPPENLYTTTAHLWAVDHSTAPPPALFEYSAASAPGAPATRVSVPFSSASPVVWTWQASSGTWLRWYGSAPATGASGRQLAFTNVVIERVATVRGPYVEDATGAHGVRSITVGSGPALVLRDGTVISCRWERSGIRRVTKLVAADGRTIALSPGRTWVEIVPRSVNVTHS